MKNNSPKKVICVSLAPSHSIIDYSQKILSLIFMDFQYRCLSFIDFYQSLSNIIIKFPYNVCSDWLKQHALSKNRVQVDDIKLAFKFLPQNFDKFDPN